MTAAINSNTADVTLTSDSIEALLEAVRVLGPSLDSVHPSKRMDIRFAVSDLREARGLIEVRAAKGDRDAVGLIDTLGYVRCNVDMDDARANDEGHTVAARIKPGDSNSTLRCDSCGRVVWEAPRVSTEPRAFGGLDSGLM